MQRSVQRLTEMLDDFLDLARVEAGRLTLKPAPFDVGRLLREAAEVFEAQALGKGLAIEVEAPDDLPAYGDPRRIAQVVANLVSNAIQFSAAGRVTLRATQGEANILLVVRDHGRGLTQEEMAELFKPFAQVAGGTHRGTGLGLYLSKAIVDAHGGRIRLESAGRGHGTTATVELPCERTLRKPA